MQNQFINFDTTTGLSINTYRSPNGYANSDVIGLVEDIVAGSSGNCPLDGALEILESNDWAGASATPELLEDLVTLIKSNNGGES